MSVLAQISSRQSDAAAVPADDLDDLFNYDVNMDDVLRDVDPDMDAPVGPKLSDESGEKENAIGLGIDEEIKVVKQRRPVPKLDEPRCVSQQLDWLFLRLLSECSIGFFPKREFQS